MSDSWTNNTPDDTSSGTGGGVSEKAETARSEASEVAGTAVDSAKGVAHTAKDEASSVAGEATSQARDLLSQTRTQLSDQASQQQQRLAGGLSSVGDELGSMASSSEGGVASDIVRQASERLSAAGTWLADRDPASVLDEVKRFARRRPLVFVASAALAGIVVGRLTRALASSGGSSGGPSGGASTTALQPQLASAPAHAAPVTTPAVPAVPAQEAATASAAGETPLYDESAAVLGTSNETAFDGEVPDDRRDAF